mgnify:CR=1 FL=1
MATELCIFISSGYPTQFTSSGLYHRHLIQFWPDFLESISVSAWFLSDVMFGFTGFSDITLNFWSMSSRMHSKPSRPWERGSPGKRRLGGGRGSPPIEHFRRRDIGSPGRSKRGKWESPSRNRVGSPSWTHRRGFESPQRAGRRERGWVALHRISITSNVWRDAKTGNTT